MGGPCGQAGSVPPPTGAGSWHQILPVWAALSVGGHLQFGVWAWMSRAHGEDGMWQEQWISSEVLAGKQVL